MHTRRLSQNDLRETCAPLTSTRSLLARHDQEHRFSVGLHQFFEALVLCRAGLVRQVLDEGQDEVELDGAVHVLRQRAGPAQPGRSEEHTSELQSLMRISYPVFC